MPPSSGSRGRAPQADRQVVVTSGGLRFVGRATELVSEPSPVAAVAALRPDDLLWATRFSLRPRSAGGDAVGILLSVLDDALGAAGAPAESLRRDGAQCSSVDRFRAVEWETFEHAGRWAGELTWIHRHPTLPGVPCTTRVTAREHEGDPIVTVHVGAPGGLSGVRGTVGAGQARPAFVQALTYVARLGFGWSDEPQVLLERDVDDFVGSVLLSEIRSHPVAVLAPLEGEAYAGPAEYVIPPVDLAEEIRGLAPLRYLERHQATYRLSDALGDKRLSCYWGALRVYMPEFSCADSGREHPLLVRDRLEDPVMRSGLIGELGRAACHRIPLPAPVAELRAVSRPPAEPARQKRAASTSAADVTGTPDDVEEAAGEGAAASVAEDRATDPSGIADGIAHALERFVDDLGSKLERLVELNEALIDEIARLRTATVVRTANVSGVERRLGQFERMLREHLRLDSAEPAWADGSAGPSGDGEAAAESDEPDLTLVEVVQHAESEHADALLILDSAVSSASESPYEDVQRVASYLKAMAEIAGRRQDGRLHMSLREAFQEAGLEYRGHIAKSTSSRLREQYVAALPSGQSVECHEHIVLGTSYDPRYCLRIYFTSRAPGEPRFVISHVGRHFEVASTT